MPGLLSMQVAKKCNSNVAVDFSEWSRYCQIRLALFSGQRGVQLIKPVAGRDDLYCSLRH